MHFPALHNLRLDCVCERVIAGKPHPDGRRYLPTVVLRLPPPIHNEVADHQAAANLLLGVVDRHHRLPPEAIGRSGTAQLVAALGALRLQTPPFRRGFAPEVGWQPGTLSMAPRILGQVEAIYSWEVTQGSLPYVALYAELLINIGPGTIGVRTSLTAADLTAALGAERIVPGDWITLDRSRIDLLGMA
jgi:hypothetical protein